MARADRDAAFTAFARGAEGTLMRTAWLLTGSGEAAAELVQTALAATYVAWPSVGADTALAHARKVAATHGLDAYPPMEGSDEIYRWLAGLPDDQRSVVVLRCYDDLSEHDTAETLGTSVSTVASLWSEAQAALRELAIADRARLGGFTRPTTTTPPPPERPAHPHPRPVTRPAGVTGGDIGHDEASGDLRRRLEATLPAHLLPLDLDAVRRRGARTVGRRRLGRVLVGVVVVAALATGADVLGRTRTTATPAPPTSSASATTAPVAPGPATLNAGGFGAEEHTYLVTLRPGADGSSTVDVHEGASTPSLVSLGPLPAAAGRRVAWVRLGATSTVVGVIPSATAQRTVDVRTDRDYGGYSIQVAPIPGTDWAAFAVTFQQPIGGASVTDVRWYDHAGRPVMKDGRVGASASVEGRTAWVTAGGRDVGVLDEGSTTAHGALPFMLVGEGGATSTTSRLTVFGPPQAVSATATLSDGRELPLHPVALDSRYSVARVSFVTDGTDYPTLTRYSWTDPQGKRRDVTP